MPFWTYILHCNAGVFYTGHTDHLENRIADHKAGRFEGFTKRYLPVELVWSQEFSTREEAKAAEKRIKGWSRAKKMALIRGDWNQISRWAKSKSSPSTSSGQADLSVSSHVVEMCQSTTASAHPNEACGILIGENDRITGLVEACNVHPNLETHFEIDPQALIDAYRDERGGGPHVIGYFHSHPNGSSKPSDTDRANSASDGKVWAIMGKDGLRFWRDAKDGFHPVSYEVAER